MYGYTLEYLSERTGVPAQTLNRYELTQRVPKIDAAVMISESLGVNPLWMQGYDAPMKKEETPGQLQLTEGEKAILALFRQVPAEHQDMVVEMIRVALKQKE
jgi:transcriptional regulator with XRE-family HTH domain